MVNIAPKTVTGSTVSGGLKGTAFNKGEFEKKLKVVEKAVIAACDEIQKSILAKGDKAEGAAEVNGLNREDLMKLVAVLDSIGSTTYPAACALRDLHNKMK